MPSLANSHVPLSPTLEAFQFIGDVKVTLTAELDRRSITFGELVRLEEGGVVVLDRPAGENIDLFIGEVLLGSGEILVVDDTLAIRIADLRDKTPTAASMGGRMDDEGSAAA